jgi:Contractile injection system tape measure protein
MLHRVNQLRFEATCATEAQAFEVRNNFSQTCQGDIAAVIDKVCSQYVSEDEWVQIDTIEVDLGNFNIQSFEKVFTNIFLTKFEKAFSKKLKAIPASEMASSKQASYFKMLIYFLQTGTMPWWAGDESINMNEVFIEVAELQRRQLYYFLEHHRFTETVWQRIAMQFDEEVHKLIFSFFPELTLVKKRIIEWANLFTEEKYKGSIETNFSQLHVKQSHKFIIQHAPLFFSTVKDVSEVQKMIGQFAEEFKSIANVAVTAVELIRKINTYEKTAAIEQIIGSETKTESEKKEKIDPPVELTREINTYEKTAAIEQIIGSETKAESEKEEEIVPLIAKETALPEKFSVQFAGIILLAPFLKQFFNALHLLEQEEWKNREAHYKAIHLIRYLASGQQMCPEHSLVMEKLLCRMEITAPIPREVELSEEEMAEAAALLQSVIANWKVLKNTSVNGLRETFLKRDGILTKKENGWLLQVERKTADVLLESIPWGYTTIALPWNSYIIFTEW